MPGRSGLQPSTVVELRQYTLHPGQRDVLIALFEREFIESQEALGIRVLGTFRDLDKPDRFVWIRGFSDMASRAAALEAFYDGPVWRAHRDAANATMVDSDNVLLLRAARVGSELTPAIGPRAPIGASNNPQGVVAANVYYFDAGLESTFVDFFEREVTPVLKAAGVIVRASYLSETTANNFPRLPVRETDRVFVWFSLFPDLADYERCLERLARSAEWRTVALSVQAKLKSQPEVIRLLPTPRSAWHQEAPA
jgi:quinol monooxygenase YgiN